MNSQLEHPNPTSRKLSFGLGSLILFATLCAVCVAWYANHNKSSADHVVGPITITFVYRSSQDSTFSNTITGASGLDFRNDQITIHTNSGGLVIPKSTLIKVEWFEE